MIRRRHPAIESSHLEAGPTHQKDAAASVVATEMIEARTTLLGISFAVKVHPRAKKNAITGEVGGTVKLAITAPPVDGKANQACIDFFAKLLKVPRSSVSIAAGETSRNKMIRVSGISAEYLRESLTRTSESA